jgi:type IV pilus assembly protein PilB
MRKKRLGEVLRERGHISDEDLSAAIQAQHGKLIRLGELLLERGKVRKQDLAGVLEEITRIHYLPCLTTPVDPEALKLVPRQVAQRYMVMPVALQGGQLVVVMSEPQNLPALDELRFVAGKEISPRLGFREEIRQAIEKYYGPEPIEEADEDGAPVISGVTASESREIEFLPASGRQQQTDALREFQDELRRESQRTPAVRLVSAIIATAVDKLASDVHIEPQAGGTAVRIRVDGVLREIMQVPVQIQNSLISRIKILADMDIAERRAPQDGRVLVQLGRRRLDLRVSTLPTHYGEKVVIRLLDPTAPRLRFRDLGLSPEKCRMLEEILALPQGMLLVTGPTGSGKTTTLYAALSQLQSPSINIVTVEDPVEYMLEGVNQVQVHSKAGLTFASCLRSILRQDPNVILVGEIRDRETAEIALKASQTGHLVLTTLHTNHSIAAVTRLLDLNIAAFLIASSVSAIMAQRLVRRLCACHRRIPVSTEYAARLRALGLDDPGEFQALAVGCDACDQTGYKGRVGVYEMLIFDDQIRSLVRSGARNEEIRALVRGQGIEFMQEDALAKIRQGITTIEEVLRVVPFEQIVRLLCQSCGRELMAAFHYCPYCGTKCQTPARRHDSFQPLTEGTA